MIQIHDLLHQTATLNQLSACPGNMKTLKDHLSTCRRLSDKPQKQANKLQKIKVGHLG